MRPPERGEVVWIDFDPQSGREQAGRRPALVLSLKKYNAAVGLMIACPITSRQKGYPFEVALPQGLPIQGVVLSDHMRSLDWRARRADFICRVPEEIIEEVVGKALTLFGEVT